jgi:hypothetical protein
MGFWDYEKEILRPFEPKQHPLRKGWIMFDCGCCNGLLMDFQTMCPRCQGSGWLAMHKITKAITRTVETGPSGLCGRLSRKEADKIMQKFRELQAKESS